MTGHLTHCGIRLFALLLLLFLGSPEAYAQGETAESDREKRLLDLIERLEQRVDVLERRLEQYEDRPEAPRTPPEAPPPADDDEAEVPTAPVERVSEPETMDAPRAAHVIASGEEGFRIRSGDERFELRIGGRVQFDSGFSVADDDLDDGFGQPSDGARFRRVWLSASGKMYEDYIYRIQLDFVGGDVEFRDVWFARRNIPGLGTLTVGQLKEPFTLEENTSNANLTFLERSFTTAFVPSRSLGIMAKNSALNDRMTWAAGYFRDSDDTGDSRTTSDGNNLTLRVTGLPWYEDDGRKLVHLGLGYSFRSPSDEIQFRSQPESTIARINYVDTGLLDIDQLNAFVTEGALVYNRYSVQTEFTHARTDGGMTPDSQFNAFYVAGSVFLTGEHRPYSRSSGGFGRVIPKRSVGLPDGEGGWGAWELTARYSGIDLNDGPVRGGRQRNLTLGLNWYLNANFRVLLNYIHADIDSALADGDAHLFLTRLQLNF